MMQVTSPTQGWGNAPPARPAAASARRPYVAAALIGLVVAAGVLGTTPARSAAPAQSTGGVPVAFRGVWGRNGRCDVAKDRLTITAGAAGWGGEARRPVAYSVADRTVTWSVQYDVGSFELGGRPGILVYNADGNGMPNARQGYAKCGQGRTRLPWPSATR